MRHGFINVQTNKNRHIQECKNTGKISYIILSRIILLYFDLFLDGMLLISDLREGHFQLKSFDNRLER
jgi:hypothetical protein